VLLTNSSTVVHLSTIEKHLLICRSCQAGFQLPALAQHIIAAVVAQQPDDERAAQQHTRDSITSGASSMHFE